MQNQNRVKDTFHNKIKEYFFKETRRRLFDRDSDYLEEGIFYYIDRIRSYYNKQKILIKLNL